MSCIPKKFVDQATAKSPTAAITKPIGDKTNANAPATAESAAVIAGKAIQIAPTTTKSAANPAATPQITQITVCIVGLKLSHVPLKFQSTAFSPSIAALIVGANLSPKSTIKTLNVHFNCSKLPAKLSSLVFAWSAALVPSICAFNLANPSAPCSASPTAALIASVPKIVLKAWFFCSSESPFKLFCKSPEISPILFSFPFASKNWFAPSFVISQSSCIAPAALSLAGTNLCKNTLKDVPASDPLANRFEIPAIDVLKSLKLTPTAFATHQPCAKAKA